MYNWVRIDRLFKIGAIPARILPFFDKPWAEARVYDAAAALLAADNASFDAKIAAYRREFPRGE